MSGGLQQGLEVMEERRRLAELRINYRNARSTINMRGPRAMIKIQSPRTDIVVRHCSTNPMTSLDHCTPMYSVYGYNLESCFLTPSVMLDRPLKSIGPGQMTSDMAITVRNRNRDGLDFTVCEALPKAVSRYKFPIIQKLKSKLKSKLNGQFKNQSKA